MHVQQYTHNHVCMMLLEFYDHYCNMHDNIKKFRENKKYNYNNYVEVGSMHHYYYY